MWGLGGFQDRETVIGMLPIPPQAPEDLSFSLTLKTMGKQAYCVNTELGTLQMKHPIQYEPQEVSIFTPISQMRKALR